MAKVTGGIRKMAEADLLPEDDYWLKIREVNVIPADTTKDGNSYEVARCTIEGGVEMDADKKVVKKMRDIDEQVMGRRADHFLGSPSKDDWRGLGQLLSSMKLTEVPEVDGEQDTEVSLNGLKFPARVTRDLEHKKGPRNNVKPIIDWDWYNGAIGKSEDGAPKESGRRSRGRSTGGKGGGRRRRS